MFFLRNLAGHSKPYLPDPDREESRRTKHAAEVREGKKIPDSHHRYDPELRMKIGRFAASSGNKAAIDKILERAGQTSR